MKFYVVRHGESTANITKIHQTADEPLTELGKRQAVSVAQRFKHIPIKKIISSPFVRAYDTAQEIHKVTETPIEKNDLFVEIKRPSELMGTILGSEKPTAVFDEIISHEQDKNWHYSDEENFYDFKERAEKALKFFEAQTEEHIAVVTHSVFMRMLVGVLAFQDDMTPDLLRHFGHTYKIHNTGITVIEYADEKWRLFTWNDYAHVEEA